MQKPGMNREKTFTILDCRIAVAVLICVLTATVLNTLNMKFTYGEMHLEIIQKMTSAISCLLVCQDTAAISKKAGINRLIITAVGGALGILVTLIDTAVNNQWLMVLMVAIGVLITLVCCKLCDVPYVNARIGGVTFILVTCTLAANARIFYAIFRFISTLYGVIISLLVTWTFSRFCRS